MAMIDLDVSIHKLVKVIVHKLEVISEKLAKVTAVLNTLVLFSIITNFL